MNGVFMYVRSIYLSFRSNFLCIECLLPLVFMPSNNAVTVVIIALEPSLLSSCPFVIAVVEPAVWEASFFVGLT